MPHPKPNEILKFLTNNIYHYCYFHEGGEQSLIIITKGDLSGPLNDPLSQEAVSQVSLQETWVPQ